MTVIAYKGRVMAADTGAIRGGKREIVAHPKIVRAPDGTLVGSAGIGSALYAFREWVRSGMDFAALPAGTDKNTEIDIEALFLRPDGTLWRMNDKYCIYPLSDAPHCIGENDAANFCEGAMEAGMSAMDAVRLTIKHCIYVARDVQVERSRG